MSNLNESWHRFDQQKPPPSQWILFTRDEDYDSALEGQYENGMLCYGDCLNFYERATSFMYWRIMSDHEIDDMADDRVTGKDVYRVIGHCGGGDILAVNGPHWDNWDAGGNDD